MASAMTALDRLLAWFAGDGRYMKLGHCMGGDAPWIALTVVLDLSVAVGYLMIARHWAINEAMLGEGPAKAALRSMKRIFLFCGLCGYLFIPIKMVWPAWRLYDIALAGLVYYTWRYALGAQHLRVIYDQLDRLNQLARELEASRNEAKRKSLFLSSISHDIRTPLNGLGLQAELAELCLSSGDTEGLRQAIGEIRRCTHAAAGLLGEFIELGRIDWSGESVRREPIAVDEAVARGLDPHRASAASKGLTLESEVEPGLVALAEPRMVDRILQNLVENAVKYTRTGGIRVVASSVPKGVEIQVIDTGVGISDEHRPHVFDEFYQVDNRERDRSKGFGLGLSITSRLADQLGGDLRVESELGRGSRFILRLPRDASFVRPGHDERSRPQPARATSLAR